MKQIIYILLTTTMLGLMSCSDWLDVSPKTSIPTDKQFESESGFKDALTGIYLKLGIQTLYAGDLTYAYLDELAGLYSIIRDIIQMPFSTRVLYLIMRTCF